MPETRRRRLPSGPLPHTLWRLVFAFALCCGAPVVAQTSKPVVPDAREARPGGGLDPQLEGYREAAEKRRASFGERTEANQAWFDAVDRRVKLLDELRQINDSDARLPGPEVLDEERAALDLALSEWREKKLPDLAPLDVPEDVKAYEAAASEARRARDSQATKLQNLEAELKTQRSTSAGLTERRKHAQTLLSVNEGNPGEIQSYIAQNAKFDLGCVDALSAYLDRAIARMPQRIENAKSQLELSELRLKHAERRLGLARQEAARMGEAAAEAEKARSDRKLEEARVERDVILRFEKTIDAEIAEVESRIAGTKSAVTQLKTLTDEHRTLLGRLAAGRKALKRRLEARPDGADEILWRAQAVLRARQQNLQVTTLPRARADARRHQERLAAAYDRQLRMQSAAPDHGILQRFVAEATAGIDNENERELRAEAAVTAFEEQRKRLVPVLKSEISELEEADHSFQSFESVAAEFGEQIREAMAFVQARLLWTRSDEPAALDFVVGIATDVLEGLGRCASPRLYEGVLERASMRPRDLALLGAITLLLAALLGVPWARRRMFDPVAPTDAAPVAVGSGRPSILQRIPKWVPVVLLAALRASIVPAGLLVAANTIDKMVLGAPIVAPIVLALRLAARYLWILFLCLTFLGPAGVAPRLGLLRADVAAQLLRSAKILTSALLLLGVPADVLAGAPFELQHLPRLLHTVSYLCLGYGMLVVLKPSSPLMRHWTEKGGGLRRILRVVGPAIGLAIVTAVALDLVGYRVAAQAMVQNTFRAFVAGLLLLASFTLLRRVIDRIARNVHRQLVHQGKEPDDAERTAEQARGSLTRLVAVTLLILGAMVLQKWWGMGDLLHETLTDWAVWEIVAGKEFLTAWDILVAVLIVVFGHLAAAAINNVYTAVVSPLTHREAEGGRFAVMTLARYGVLLAAYAFALMALGVSTSGIGWILTAASVGIGFGLQEIVANFISGVILLFERPVRVGDIIEVGTTAGVVKRITIRATYVTNWDRQTIVVPNKQFITQSLTNWTREDRIMRRTLKVGVAHGSDVERVVQVLDEILREHPKILRDPPHRIHFFGFDEFGLNIKVWLFTVLDDGFTTMTEVYTEIHRRFREAGIHITVPSREVWMREAAALPLSLEEPK